MTQLLPRASLALLALCLLHLPGCDRHEEIQAYNAPKDAPAPVESAAAEDRPAPPTWTVPAGWQEASLQTMEFAAFLVPGNRPDTRVTVIPLPYSPEQLGSNINRWEGQLSLPQTPAGEVEKLAKPLADGHVPMSVVDLAGKDAKAGTPKRIVAAIAEHQGIGWFFKVAGQPEVVEEQKSAFEAFLRSVDFPEADHPAAPHSHEKEAAGASASSRPAATHLEWGTLPVGWVVDSTPNQFRNYAFKISGAGGEGELAITRMSSESAREPLKNINMWRNDVGLPALKDGKESSPIDYSFKDRPGIGFDIAGPERRILVVMTGSGDNEAWFFKLRGSVAFVEAQKGSFESFLKSVSFVGDAH